MNEQHQESQIKKRSLNSSNLGSLMDSEKNAPLQSKNFLALGQKIKSRNYTKSEHISFLETEITEQLIFIKSNLVSKEQQALFTLFKTEFEQRKDRKELSYEWWLMYTYRLSILVTTKENRQAVKIGNSDEDPFSKKFLQNNAWLKHDDFLQLAQKHDALPW